MCIIAPSLLEADYKCLGEQLKTMEKSGAEYVHIDVMDGSFVPNLACGMKMIHGLKGVADLEACRCDTGYDRSSGKRWPALY